MRRGLPECPVQLCHTVYLGADLMRRVRPAMAPAATNFGILAVEFFERRASGFGIGRVPCALVTGVSDAAVPGAVRNFPHSEGYPCDHPEFICTNASVVLAVVRRFQ